MLHPAPVSAKIRRDRATRWARLSRVLKAWVLFLPVLALGWLQTSSTLEGDPPEIFVDMLSKGVSTLAVREFSAVDAQKSARAKEIADVMRDDLTFASVYRVVEGPVHVDRKPTGTTRQI